MAKNSQPSRKEKFSTKSKRKKKPKTLSLTHASTDLSTAFVTTWKPVSKYTDQVPSLELAELLE